MQIIVDPSNWGEASLGDIEALLLDVASHIQTFLRKPLEGAIVVRPAPAYDWVPKTLFREFAEGSFFIQLTARDRKWSRFSYQFSHEFCHVLSEHERLKDSPNNWFHETICELASVFTLRRMAQQWPSNPPYANWADYAESLASYAQERLSRKEHQLPEGTTLSAWLLSEEEALRKDPYQRCKNAVVAYSLLPIFESDPTGWNAIQWLPDSSALFKDYLSNWHSQVEPIDKPFVNCIIQLFEE